MTAPAKGAEWYDYQKALNEEVEAARNGQSTLLAKNLAQDDAIADIIAAGISYMKITKTQADSPYTVTAGNLAGPFCITNISASGELVCNLPAVGATDRIAFFVAAGYNVKVVADGTEKFRFLGSQTAGGGYVQSSTIGTFWIIDGINGEWVVTILNGELYDGTSYYSIYAQSNNWRKAQIGTYTALTDGATINWTLADANNFKVTLGGDRTLSIADTPVAGQSGVLLLIQDGTGGRDISSWDAKLLFVDGISPDPSGDAASAIRKLSYEVISATQILIDDHGTYS